MTLFLPGALMAISEGAKPFARFLLSGASVLVVVDGLRTLKRIASGNGELVRLFAKMASLLTAILTGFVVVGLCRGVSEMGTGHRRCPSFGRKVWP